MRSVVVLGTIVALAACPVASAELAVGSRSAEEGWVVSVSVKAVGLGPVEVSVGPLGPARGWVRGLGPVGPPSSVRGSIWRQHDLILTNTGNRPVGFADTWTAAVLGPRRRPMLIATADHRCGYYAVRPLRAGCILPLVFVRIGPQRSVTRLATLWKGLRRMAPLQPGVYVFRQPLRYYLGRHGAPRRAGLIKLVYRVEPAA